MDPSPVLSQRQILQQLLEDLLGTDSVYFQPPASLRMRYPCIVYNRDRINATFADNRTYGRKTRYQVTYIDQNPDSTIPDRIAELPLCVYNRFFTADNLNHDVFTLFF